jgi:hypothetical protein
MKSVIQSIDNKMPPIFLFCAKLLVTLFFVSEKVHLYRDGNLPRRSTMTDYRVHAGDAKEDQVTAAIEKYTAPVPSSAYLALALASIAASVTLQITQKEKANAALFVGQWVAPFLLLGIYNKLVKQHGSDAQTR